MFLTESVRDRSRGKTVRSYEHLNLEVQFIYAPRLGGRVFPVQKTRIGGPSAIMSSDYFLTTFVA